jgi:iron complex transport system substrate-binding protein
MNGHPTPRRTPARPQSATPTLRHARLRAALLAALLGVALLAAVLVAGCGTATTDTTATTLAPSTTLTPSTTLAPTTTTAPAFPVTVTDDNGDTATVKAEPLRIVSTAPASTETLFALGVGDRVVGVTSLDDYPLEVKDIAKIGDFTANTEAVMALSPDLVVGYSGNEEALAPVKAAGAAVIIFNPPSLDGIYANITTLGAVTGTAAKAAELIDGIKAQVKAVTDKAAALSEKPKVFYAVDNTLWTCGPGSFVDELLSLVNVVNVASLTPDAPGVQPYYQFSPEQLVAADPDVILLPNTAYTSAEEFTKDARFAGLNAVKNGHVYVVNDILITRPGARIGQGVKALAEAVHPGATF